MKLQVSVLLLALSGSAVLAKEKPRDETRHQRYASGEMMERIMSRKQATWSNAARTGLFSRKKFRSSNKFTACANGHVTLNVNGTRQTFQCNNLDVTGHLTHGDLGSKVNSEEIGASHP
jgi:hypothetical protein